MNRKQAKELLPAIKHFADGGNLWRYNNRLEEWESQTIIEPLNKESNIIEDKHFEARKAFALGEEIEYEKYTYGVKTWVLRDNDSWFWSVDYRPKPKEPVYEWQWYTVNSDKTICLTLHHCIEKDMNSKMWTKFKPSKRIRK